MTSKGSKPPKKLSREERLAENLRANLRRRKTAVRKAKTQDKSDNASEST